MKRSPSLILLEEWGTSGRVRPTVGHLLQLLVRIVYFRAADYVAHILGEEAPQRPDDGIAKFIEVPAELYQAEVESRLNQLHYPNTESLLPNVPSAAFNANRNYPNELNIDQRKVSSSTGPQPPSTQSNNNATNLVQQLEQLPSQFMQLNTTGNVSESRNTQGHHMSNVSNSTNRTEDRVPSLSNGVSNETHETSVSLEISVYNSDTNFIPVAIGNGLLSAISVSPQSPVVTSDNGTKSNHTESTEISAETVSKSFSLPLSLSMPNVEDSESSQSSTQSSIDSESNYSLDSKEIPLAIVGNDHRLNSEISTVSSEINSSSSFIPLSVMNGTDNLSSKHNGSSAYV